MDSDALRVLQTRREFFDGDELKGLLRRVGVVVERLPTPDLQRGNAKGWSRDAVARFLNGNAITHRAVL